MKHCNTCNKIKELTHFYKSKPTKCKGCISIQSKINYRKKNPHVVWEKCTTEEERKTRKARHFKAWLARNREYNKKRAKVWRDNNKERIKEYNKNNRDSILANTRKRQALKKRLTPELSSMENSMIKALYFISKVLSNSCNTNFNVDHIVPLSKGGLHNFENLQILTEHENKSKGNKTWQ